MTEDQDNMHKAFTKLEAAASGCLDSEHYLKVQHALDSINSVIGCPIGGGGDDGEAVPCDKCIEDMPGGHEMMIERAGGDNMRWHTYDGHCDKCPVGELA